VPGLALYGPIEIEYYQLTPTGAQRVTSRDFKGISVPLRSILTDLYSMGGTAEFDELKFRGGTRSPVSLKAGMIKLVDLGLVVPVQAGPQVQQRPVPR